jgi:hypothetical protein
MTTSIHEHDRPAEAEPGSKIYTQQIKMSDILLDPKLYSKVF